MGEPDFEPYISNHKPEGFGFKRLDPQTPEVVLCAHYNYYGTRLALGCADHRIRVYDKDAEGTLNIADTWRGHDGEVMDVGDLYHDMLEY